MKPRKLATLAALVLLIGCEPPTQTGPTISPAGIYAKDLWERARAFTTAVWYIRGRTVYDDCRMVAGGAEG